MIDSLGSITTCPDVSHENIFLLLLSIKRVMSLDSSYPPDTRPQLQQSLLLVSVLLVLRLQSRNSPKLLSSGLTHIVGFRKSMMERNALSVFICCL